jgi:hypothetical protein
MQFQIVAIKLKFLLLLNGTLCKTVIKLTFLLLHGGGG